MKDQKQNNKSENKALEFQNQGIELNKKNLKGVAGGGPRDAGGGRGYIQVTTGTGTRNITMIGGVVYVEDPPGHWRPETEEEWEARRIR